MRVRVCVCVCVCVREGEVYLVGVDREAGLAEHLPDLGNKRGTPYTQHKTTIEDKYVPVSGAAHSHVLTTLVTLVNV